MRLELGTFPVHEIRWGAATRYAGGVLEVDRSAIESLAAGPIRSLQADIARPGSSTRIIHVLDVVEPRCRPDGRTSFPGILGAPSVAGSGRSHRLAGAAVVAAAEIGGSLDSQSIKEAIIDMGGPGAAYSEFSGTQNLVLTFSLDDRYAIPEQTAAIRRTTLLAAEHLGRSVADQVPAQVETYEPAGARRPDLPSVAYVCPLMHEGELHDTFVYGVRTQSLPTLMHPNEILDGAVVTGDYHIAAMRGATYHYQNNPVLRELYRRDGRDLNLVGAVIAQVLILTDLEKERSARQTAKLCRMIGAQGAVVSMQNGGHGYADLMMLCAACEQAGVATVPILLEMADEEGGDQSLLMHLPEVDTIVSTGNMDQVVSLPAVDRVLGGTRFVDMNNYEGALPRRPEERLATALRRMYCACGQVGALPLTGRGY